jgi:tripartite ATP-independent transporter DctM subunit
MTALTPWLGLILLLFVGLGVVFTGIPAAVVLLGAACFGIVIGALSGDVPVQLLGVLPERLINLLESDLLQAIPLYVLMGALINRLPLADALYRCGLAIVPGPAAPAVSGIALGALLGPMNGSVGASVLALTRVAEPRLAASGIALPRRAAIITVASTLGVVVPPSLVLILLGDAMLNAHTVAVIATGREDRVINTQDVFHGALIPAGLYLVGCFVIAWWFNRGTKAQSDETPTRATPRPTVQQIILAAVTVLAILILLGGVTTGYFYAVEAAAMGGFILLLTGLVSGRLPLPILNEILRETLALTGALFFLLVAATTLTLVLRIFGTDQLVADWIAALPGGALGATVIVLAGIALSALVLDAFEIIFVIVPIVIPPLLIRVADARWVAVLVLLALQASFINPLIGYAVMMTRTVLKRPIAFTALLRSLAPYLFAQAALLLAVLFVPQLTHVGQQAADSSRKPPAISDEELERRFEQMLRPAAPAPLDVAPRH